MVPLPSSLEGMRCLDVATADGFWAFEMERRGASEVLAIDVRPARLDWPADTSSSAVESAPAPEGFGIARQALKSNVEWRELSAYDLDPADIGQFDFVFMGSLLAHLRDPARALSAVQRVLRGELLSVDAISLPLTLLHPRRPVAHLAAASWPLWWIPNACAYEALFAVAKLAVLERGSPFFLKRGPAYKPAYGDLEEELRLSLRRRLRKAVSERLGNLHMWIRAAPLRS